MPSLVEELRNACQDVSTELSASSVARLAVVVPKVLLLNVRCCLLNLSMQVPENVLVTVLEYMLLPLRVMIGHPSSKERDVIAASNCITLLFSRTLATVPEAAVATHAGTFLLLLDGTGMHIPLSEEIISSFLSTLDTLTSSTKFAVPLLSDNKAVAFGHGIHALQGIADDRKLSASVRTKSLEISARLIYHAADIVPRVAAFSLPGIASGLARVIHSELHLNSSIAVHALKCWTIALTKITSNTQQPEKESLAAQLEDFVSGKEASKPVPRPQSQKPKEKGRGRPEVEQDEAWWQTTESRLVDIVHKVCKDCVVHDNARVRLALVKFCFLTASRCHAPLPRCIPQLVDTLSLLMSDSIPMVSAAAGWSISMLARIISDSEDDSAECHVDAQDRWNWKRLVSDLLHDDVYALERLSKSAMDDVILQTVCRMTSLASILQSDLHNMLSDASFRKHLLQSLGQLLRIDFRFTKISSLAQTEAECSLEGGRQPRTKSRACFVLFQDERILEQIGCLLRVFAAQGLLSGTYLA